VNSALFQSPFYAAYGKVMLHPPEQPAQPSIWAPKICACCARPLPAAARVRAWPTMLAEIFAEARAAGLGQEDWAVGQYRMAQRRGQIRER
jgi:hypothetical protein